MKLANSVQFICGWYVYHMVLAPFCNTSHVELFLRNMNTVECLYKGMKCHTKTGKFGLFPRIILYKLCLFYPWAQLTSFDRPLSCMLLCCIIYDSMEDNDLHLHCDRIVPDDRAALGARSSAPRYCHSLIGLIVLTWKLQGLVQCPPIIYWKESDIPSPIYELFIFQVHDVLIRPTEQVSWRI